MNKIITLLILLFVSSSCLSQDIPSKKKIFIQEISIHAERIHIKYDIPYEVTISVAILESRYGTNKNARIKRNLLGIMYNGSLREFDTNYEAFEYFGKLLSGTLGNDYLKDRYSPLKRCDNFRSYCIMLQSIGYCSSEGYAKRLIDIILENNLHIRP